MAIPDFQSCMRPLLDAVSDGQIHTTQDAYENVCLFFELTDEERKERLPSGKQTIIRNRLAWSRAYMGKAGLLQAPQKGQIQITERGQQALNDQKERIDIRYLKQFPEFVAFHTAKPKSETSAATQQTTSDQTDDSTDPQERLEQAHQEIQNSLAGDILQTIKDRSPAFLEKLVVELMQAMGYGGWSKDSGQTTQYTADGGIDGIINEDPLGLDTIYLQATNWQDSQFAQRSCPKGKRHGCCL